MPPRHTKRQFDEFPRFPRKAQGLRIVSLKQAAALLGISVDTLKRRYAEKIVTLSPRRKGVRLQDALLLSEEDAALLLSSEEAA